MNHGYWIGPYGVHVSNELNHIVAADGYNILYKDGSVTQRLRADRSTMSQQDYFAHFTVVINGVRWFQQQPQRKVDEMDTD